MTQKRSQVESQCSYFKIKLPGKKCILTMQKHPNNGTLKIHNNNSISLAATKPVKAEKVKF